MHVETAVAWNTRKWLRREVEDVKYIARLQEVVIMKCVIRRWIVKVSRSERRREDIDADNGAADTREVGYRRHALAEEDVRTGECNMFGRTSDIAGKDAHSAESAETRFQLCEHRRVLADTDLKIVIAVIAEEFVCKTTCFTGFAVAMIATLAGSVFIDKMWKLGLASKDFYCKRQPIEVRDVKSSRRTTCAESAEHAIDMVNSSPRTWFCRSYHCAWTHGDNCVEIHHIADDGKERTIKSRINAKTLLLKISKVENTDGRTSEDVNIVNDDQRVEEQRHIRWMKCENVDQRRCKSWKCRS